MTLVRWDRGHKEGGGVAIYADKQLRCVRATDPLLTALPDSVWCHFTVGQTKHLLGSVYRSPSCGAEHSQLLLSTITGVRDLGYDQITIAGDFNAPSLNIGLGCAQGKFSWDLLYAIGNAGFTEKVGDDTRWGPSGKSSKLDYILTSDQLLVENVKIMTPLGSSDHAVIVFDMVLCERLQWDTTLPCLCYSKANYTKMRRLLSDAEWPEDWNNLSIEEHWKTVKEIIHTAISDTVPVVTQQPRKRSSWLRRGTQRILQAKRKAWFTWRLSNSQTDYEAYLALRNRCNIRVRCDRRSFQANLARKLVSNPKSLYRFMSERKSTNQGACTLEGPSGQHLTSLEMAETFSLAFDRQLNSKVGTTTTAYKDRMSSPPKVNPIGTILINPEMVLGKLKRLTSGKSPGCDDIRPSVLKQCSEALCKPLCDLFQHSLDSGKLPKEWKRAIVSPIFKGGNRQNAASYRPVALLPVVSKVLESLVDDHIRQHLDSTQILHGAQHGFRKGRSCVTNLLSAWNDWTLCWDLSVPVHVIFLDFAKAFDTVQHDLLLHKISQVGIAGPLLPWLEDYLDGREFCTKVNRIRSSWHSSASGVSQGSILGPLMFLIFINDLPCRLNSPALLYADDVKIWRAIKSTEDSNRLQTDLESLEDWALVNGMAFNLKKCKVVQLRTCRPQNASYSLCNDNLCCVTSERDLGLVLTEKLDTSVNYTGDVARAYAVIHFAHRQLGALTPELFLRLYKTYVRPHLEVHNVVAPPLLRKDINRLERVQRRATKGVIGLRNKPYEERLKKLGLFTLSYRRLRGDLITAYKITKDENHPNKGILPLSKYELPRGNPRRIAHQRAKTRVRSHFFSLRVCRPWNSLPADVATAPSVESFKRRLDNHAATKGLCPNGQSP